MTVIVSDPICKSTKIGRYANNTPLFFAVQELIFIFANEETKMYYESSVSKRE